MPPHDGTYAPHPPHTPDRRTTPRRYVHGDQRTAGWLRGSIREALCCPRGHHVRDGALILQQQLVRCEHRDVAGAQPCGLIMWVLPDHRCGAAYVAEVDYADVEAIRTHRDFLETLAYLGGPYWPDRTVARRR